MGALQQALRGLGKGLEATGLMGLQSTIAEERDKRLATFKGRMTAETAGKEQIFRAEESARERASREKIAGISAGARAKAKPAYHTIDSLEYGKEQYRTLPGGGVERLDIASGAWVSGSMPRGMAVEEATPLGAEIADKFTTAFGGDISDIRMPEEVLADIVTQDLVAGGDPVDIEAGISAAIARGKPYQGLAAAPAEGTPLTPEPPVTPAGPPSDIRKK